MDQHFTLEEIAVSIEVCKLREGGVKIIALEQSVVMEVGHAGILDRALVQQQSQRYLLHLHISADKYHLAGVQQFRRQQLEWVVGLHYYNRDWRY